MASGRRLPLVHPSEILRDEFLTPMDLSVYRLARPMRVLRPQLNDILLGRRSVTTDTVLAWGRIMRRFAGDCCQPPRAIGSLSHNDEATP